MLCPIDWRGTAPLTSSTIDRQFLMLTAARYSQVNCCIPQIMFSFWFHSSHILLHGEQFAAIGCPWYYQGQSERIECDRLSLNAKIKRSRLCFLSLWHQQGKGLLTTAPAVKSTGILWCLKYYQAEYNVSLHSSAPENYRAVNLFALARWSSHLHAANKHGGHAWWTRAGRLRGEGGHVQCKPARTEFCTPVLMLSFYDDNISWPSFYLAPHSSATSSN